MLSAEDILKIIKSEIKGELAHSFPIISTTLPGIPVPLYNSQKSQKYWLVPLLLGKKVRGLAIFDLSGKLVSHGILSPNVMDEGKLMDKDFFESVPITVLDKIRKQHRGVEFATPFLSYDETPRKWGWLLQVEKENEAPKSIFIGPQGWYEKQVLDGREGI
jgi:hypothetical protein